MTFDFFLYSTVCGTVSQNVSVCTCSWPSLGWDLFEIIKMTSSNGNTGEFPHKWPVTRSFDVFFDLNKRLGKQWWGWWFETPSHSLWRHCNGHELTLCIIDKTPWIRLLTHWGRVTHTCVGKLTIIGSDNGLSPGRHQAIIWNNAETLLIRTLETNFSEILIGIQTFSFKKMYLKMSCAKWRPFCLGLNVLKSPSTVLHRGPGKDW